jgi:hypothetical protein
VENKASLLKGCLCGVGIALIETAMIILFFFVEMTSFLLYSTAFVCGIISLFLLINNKIKAFAMSLLLSVITFFTAELIIESTGVIKTFFQLKYGADAEMWAGDGFGMVAVLIYCLAGSCIGTVGSLIITIKKRSTIEC